MWRNEDLYKAFHAAIQAALSLLASKPLIVKDNMHITFTEGGWKAGGGNYVPDWGQLSDANVGELLQLPELDQIVQVATREPTTNSILLKNVTDTAEQKHMLYISGLERFLSTYLTATQDRTFKVEPFERIYAQLEEYIYGFDLIKSIWHIYFRNFSIEEDSIELEEGIYLRKATQDEKEDEVKYALRRETPPHIPEAVKWTPKSRQWRR